MNEQMLSLTLLPSSFIWRSQVGRHSGSLRRCYIAVPVSIHFSSRNQCQYDIDIDIFLPDLHFRGMFWLSSSNMLRGILG